MLKLQKATGSEINVLLMNDQDVAAIQFTITGDGVTLGGVSQGVRTGTPLWQMSTHKVDESTINVVILRTGIHSLPAGEGTIASVAVSSGSGRLSLSRVVIASPDAQSISAALADLEWFNNSDDAVVLGQNYPNPFNPTTTIPFTLDRQSTVRLLIYDIAGREVKRVIEENKSAGSHMAVWNGTDEHGIQVPSGVYFVRVQAGSSVQTKKMILAR
jgi:hypothetical protein